MILVVAKSSQDETGQFQTVIAGMVPTEILAEERKRVYEVKNTGAEQGMLKKIEVQQNFQQRDGSAKRRWTHRLIPEIECWVNRKHGESNYCLTQMLRGHGWGNAGGC